LFEIDIHRAARETVTAVENRYEKDDVNFDSAWQEVLNHATIQVKKYMYITHCPKSFNTFYAKANNKLPSTQ